MTTIAWDGERLAADRLVVGSRAYGMDKIWRSETIGLVIATSGHVSDGIVFTDWVEKFGVGAGARELLLAKLPGPKLKKDFAALLIVKDGDWNAYVCHDDCVPVYQPGKCAIGAGAQYALGAMETGASAVEAVLIAIRLLGDMDCGADCWNAASSTKPLL